MALQLKGPGPAAMKALAAKLVKAGKAQDAMARNMAEAGLDLVKEAMSSEEDPWGTAWPGLVLRAGTIGRDTGGMVKSLHVSSRGPSGFTLAFSKHYAGYFHGGTGIYGPSGKRISGRGGGRRGGAWKGGGGGRGGKSISSRSTGALAFTVRGATGTKGGRGKKGFVFMSVAGSPPRPLFPSGGRMPPKWKRELKATADEVIRQALK